MQERLQMALQRLLQGQDKDTVNEAFTTAICQGNAAYADDHCRVDLSNGTVNIFNGKTGDEEGFIKFSIDIKEKDPQTGFKVVFKFITGSREVELKIVNLAEGVVFWATGFWDSNDDEWLTLEIHDQSMLDDGIPPVTEKQGISNARKIVSGLIRENGRIFKTVDDILEATKNADDISYLT